MPEVAAPVTAPEPVAAVEPPAPVPETPAPESVDALPEWAQKKIKKLDSEDATNRVRAKTATETLEATKAAILKAFGVGDQDDPVAAAKTATEQREAAQSVARNLRIENAVLRSAGRAGADPLSLTDSRSFMRALEALDPEADEFAAEVDKAIAAALKANPNLRAGPAAPPARSGGPVGGGAPLAGQLSREDLKGMTPEAIEQARVDGRLDAIQGIVK